MSNIVLMVLCLLMSFNGQGLEKELPQTNEGVELQVQNVDTQIYDLTVDSSAEYGPIETKSDEEIQAELNRIVEAGMMTIQINLRPTFVDGGSEGNLLIVNDERNYYPQMVKIYRKDNEELIYQSELIPVGDSIEYDRLMIELPQGEYSCVAHISSIDSDGVVVGQAGAELLIKIEG